MSMTHLRASSFCLVVLIALAAHTGAQSITATLAGRITETSGAAVVGARVTATNVNTRLARVASTTEAGEYSIAALPAGEYAVTIEQAGFAKETRRLTLQIGQTARLECVLQVGAVQEQIEIVAADTATQEPTRSEISAVVTQRQIAGLPVNGRQFIDFVLLTPGVTVGNSTGGDGDVIYEPVTKLSFGGQNYKFNFVAIDGADNLSTASNIQKTTPSQEAVQEFRVINANYSVEFGRSAAGLVNIITKSGTNQWRGTAYQFLRHNALDARSPLTSPGLDRLQQSQYGVALGGPVKRDRTFFFGNYEGQRRTEHPFYNAVILAYLPLINQAKTERYGLPAEDLNVLRRTDYDNVLAKLDHALNARQQLSARHFFVHSRYTNVSPQNDGVDLPSAMRDDFITDHSTAASLISTFSPRFINEVRGQFARRDLRFPTTSGQPHLEVGNAFISGVHLGNPESYTDTRYEVLDNVTLPRARHTFGFGGNFNYVKLTESFPAFYPFSAIFTTPEEWFAGHPVALFFGKFDATATRLDTAVLNNKRLSDDIRRQALGRLPQTYSGVYAQDHWRATERLALTLGVRYDLEAFGSKTLDAEKNNFDPRFGFAYDFGGQRSFVVRGGAGLFHGTIPTSLLIGQASCCGGSGPYPGRERAQNDVNAAARIFLFASGAPQRNAAALAGLFATGVYPTAETPFDFMQEAVIVRFNRRHQMPYSIQTSLGFSFEPWRGATFDASYLRVKGVHLGGMANINQPVPTRHLPNGKADFAALRFDPYNAVPGAADPRYSFYFEADSRWNSVYDGLLANFNTRLSRWLQGGVSYTWSKTIDDGPNTSFQQLPQNVYRLDQERGLSSDHLAHRFVAHAVLNTPAAGRAAWRNWQLSLLATLESPRYFNKFAGFDANGDGFTPNDRVGIEGRNTFKGDNYRSLDLRLARRLNFTERLKGEVLIEAFNVFNTLNERFYNTVYGDGDFNPAGTPGTFRDGARNPFYGQPRALNPPRQLQLAFRFTF